MVLLCWLCQNRIPYVCVQVKTHKLLFHLLLPWKKIFLVHLWWSPMNIQPYSSVAVSSLRLPRVCDFAPCSWQCMKNQRLAQTINPLTAFFWPKLLISFWSQGFHYFLGILTRLLKGGLLHFNQNLGGGGFISVFPHMIRHWGSLI